jgi:hypothetical protein
MTSEGAEADDVRLSRALGDVGQDVAFRPATRTVPSSQRRWVVTDAEPIRGSVRLIGRGR